MRFFTPNNLNHSNSERSKNRDEEMSCADPASGEGRYFRCLTCTGGIPGRVGDLKDVLPRPQKALVGLHRGFFQAVQ